MNDKPNSQLSTVNSPLIPPGYKLTEVGVIPEDWDIKRLGDMGDVVRGGSPRPAGDPRYFNGNFIPWLTVAALTNISEHQLDVINTAGFLTEEGSKHSRILSTGTLIIANSGATLGVAKLLGMTCCANDGIAAIINQSDGDKKYLCFYINSQTRNLREVIATGNGQPNLNTGLIWQLVVPYPPLAEQSAIAAALSDLDALIAKLDQIIAKKRDIKQAAMQELLTGKTRLPIRMENGELKMDNEGNPVRFSGEWEKKPISSFSTFVTKGATPTTYGFNWEKDGVVFLRSECVSSNGLDLTQSMFISKVAHTVLNRGEVQSGDILMTITGNVGRVIRLGSDFGIANINQHIARIRVNSPDVLSEFIFHWLSQHNIRANYSLITTGQAYPQISLKQVRDTVIPLPSLSEQTAIARVLSDMDAEIAAFEARREKTKLIKQGMMQELLTGRTRLVDSGQLIVDS
jgi:type I restriction enzyme S subunit